MKKILLTIALLAFPAASFAQGVPSTGLIRAAAATCGTVNSTACVIVQLNPNNGAVGVSIKNTFAAVLVFEGAVAGETPALVQCTATSDATAATGTTDTEGTWQCPVAGLSLFQVRASAYTSGGAQVALQPSTSTVHHTPTGAGTGTVTAVATTAPITGGTITTSGTIACGTCLSSSSTIGTGAIPIGQGTRVLLTDADLSFTGGDTLNAAKIIGGIITDSALTATRVTFAGAAGLLADDADLTFATDTLTSTKLVGSTSITDSGLTATRVTFAGTAGILSDDADLTFTGGNTLTTTNLVVNGTTTGIPFNAIWSLPGAPAGTTTYPVFVAASGLSFPDDWAASTCKVLTNATATWTATVKKNGSSVGTVAVATNGVCTFLTSGGATAFSSGDYMTITTPTADATLADVMFNFVGTRT